MCLNGTPWQVAWLTALYDPQRFGIEGCEALLPGVDALLGSCARHGVRRMEASSSCVDVVFLAHASSDWDCLPEGGKNGTPLHC